MKSENHVKMHLDYYLNVYGMSDDWNKGYINALLWVLYHKEKGEKKQTEDNYFGPG